jgi:hypothetical protein
MFVTPEPGRLKQQDLELEACLGYIASSRPAGATSPDSVSNKQIKHK